MAKTVLQNWSLVAQFLPLLPVLVYHPDVVVDVRTRLPVVNVSGIVRPLRGVAPELENFIDVVFVVQVDEGKVHEALLADDRTVAKVLVVVGKMVLGSVEQANEVSSELYLYYSIAG